VTGKVRVWGDVREDGKDELIRELENCENGTGEVSIRPKELMEELVLRLVWGAEDRWIAGCCFPTRRYASLEKNVRIFSPWRFMILQRGVHRQRIDEVSGKGVWSQGTGSENLNFIWKNSCRLGDASWRYSSGLTGLHKYQPFINNFA